jgi:acetylglutamate kinase
MSDWISGLQGRTVVIKFGGNAMVDEQLVSSFAEDVADLVRAGVRVVVVHGGGPQISRALEKAGIPNEFIGGLRVTTKEATSVIKEVLHDEISVPLAKQITNFGVPAIVLDGSSMEAKITKPELGFVGEIVSVSNEHFEKFLEANQVPVIGTIAPDASGDWVNVNADLAAASVAISLGAEVLLVLTDVEGLYSNWPDKSSFVSEISSSELDKLIPSLEAGMIPKMEGCLVAVQNGVDYAQIIDGSKLHAIKNLVSATVPVGTRVKKIELG